MSNAVISALIGSLTSIIVAMISVYGTRRASDPQRVTTRGPPGLEQLNKRKRIIPALILLAAAVAFVVYPLLSGWRLASLWSPVGAPYIVNGLLPIGTAVIVILEWPLAKRIAVINFILAFGFLSVNRFSGMQKTLDLYYLTYVATGPFYTVVLLISLAALLLIILSPGHSSKHASKCG